MENVFEVHKKSFGEGNGTLVPFPFKTQPKKLALKKFLVLGHFRVINSFLFYTCDIKSLINFFFFQFM